MVEFERTIVEIKPDILYLQGLFQNCIFPCLRLAKKYKIKVLLAPRGELCAGAFQKKYKKVPYIMMLQALGLSNNVHFQSTSEEETMALRKWLHVSKNRIHYLTNIPSLPKKSFEHKKKEIGKVNIIFLSRIHPKKNLIFALNCLKSIKGFVQFDIYGPLEDKEYWNRCEKIITELPLNVKARYCGLIDHDKVHETFAKYDLFFFPTFSENFGHVIAEALFVGCPVLISDKTPFSDVDKYGAGHAISLNNRICYINELNNFILIDNHEMRNISDSAKKYIRNKLNIENIKMSYENAIADILFALKKEI